MPAKRPLLTTGQADLRRLCNDLLTKLTRLRNKASLVAGEPVQGRNLTALRNTCEQAYDVMEAICEPRCLVCGCTDDDCSQCVEKTGSPCTWARPGLCSACAEGE